MREFRNDCVDCDNCVHCGRDKTPVLVCDSCQEEHEILWEWDGEELCEDCLLEAVKSSTEAIY